MSRVISAFDESVTSTFPAIFATMKEQGILNPTITLEKLSAALNPEQQIVVKQILALDPKDYEVKTPYAGDLEPVPADLIAVSDQQYRENGESRTLDDKFIPRRIHDAYLKMNKAFMADCPGRKLLIGACYRSPAYQVVVFIDWLTNHYEGDIGQTIRHASPPTYSQHTIASKAAIDFMTVDGSPSPDRPEDFKETIEYAWLRQHANKFGFFESWLDGNEFGMRPEPWHWQYLGQS